MRRSRLPVIKLLHSPTSLNSVDSLTHSSFKVIAVEHEVSLLYFIYKGLHFVIINRCPSERKQLLYSHAILTNLLPCDDRLTSKMT